MENLFNKITLSCQTKCERYWPDPTFRMQEKYGDIVVTFDSAIGRDGYQITSLYISHSQVSSNCSSFTMMAIFVERLMDGVILGKPVTNTKNLLYFNPLQSLEAPRRIYHYWYTAWPDHGVPDSPRQFLRLVEEVHIAQEREDVKKGPVVVHCRLVITC